MFSSDDVQLGVRIEDWISSLGEEIQNRLGIMGGMHTINPLFQCCCCYCCLACPLCCWGCMMCR